MKGLKSLKLLLTLLLIARSAVADSTSNITLATTASYTVTGVYLQALYAGSSCSGTNLCLNTPTPACGAMWTGGLVMNNQSVTLGANYLYEMIDIATYEGYQDDGAINPHTTPGANSYNFGLNSWCIKLGVAAGEPVIPQASVTTALLPLVISISIPITCYDNTITCVATTPTTQNF